MKKNESYKLVLHRETLHLLESDLRSAVAGGRTASGGGASCSGCTASGDDPCLPIVALTTTNAPETKG